MASLPHPRKLALFAALSLADLALTWHLLQNPGSGAYESNPVAAWWLAHFGWAGLAGFKGGAVLLAATLSLVVSRHRPRAAGWVLAFGCSALLAVVLYSGLLVRGMEAGRDAAAERGGTDETPSPTDEKEEAADRAVRGRLDIKDRLTADVAEGRLSLLEAAARFRDLNREWSTFQLEAFRETWPGRSDDERYCRQIIYMVRAKLRDRPAEGLAVVVRLQAELRHRLRRGDLRLPVRASASSSPGAGQETAPARCLGCPAGLDAKVSDSIQASAATPSRIVRD
jgi:hypothetical protein